MKLNPQTFSKIEPLKSKRSLRQFFTPTITLLTIIAILQLVLIVIAINPAQLYQQWQDQLTINEIAAKAEFDRNSNPVLAVITDVEALRSDNGANAQVYKDAQNGDSVLGIGQQRIIVYRRSEGKIVYDGDNPATLVTKAQEKLVNDVKERAKARGLVPQDSTETPQLSLVTDAQSLLAADPNFYKNARNGDVIAIFQQAKLIVLYNQESNEIFSYGAYNTSITPKG